jgi:hypothetical protein
MSLCYLSIGDASDPKFRWDNGDYGGNIPEIILDLGSIGLLGCLAARSLLQSPTYGGKVLDWGSCGARLTKARIIEFLNKYKGQLITEKPVLSAVQALEDDREYILFAWED